MMILRTTTIGLHPFTLALAFLATPLALHAAEPGRTLTPPEKIVSTWDDLTEGVTTPEQWSARKSDLKRRYLELLRDQHKPAKRPPLDLQVHESVVVDGLYERRLVSYSVEADERAHAYIGIPLKREKSLPGVVAMHGTSDRGKEMAAGLAELAGPKFTPDKAYLDHLCRRGYVAIAPDHFTAGHRIPKEGSYVTSAFYEKHPDWTAVGKFTYEHSIAIDVLQSLPEVDKDHIGCMGHSLGGQGTLFLAAYDERIKAAASNCTAPTFRQNAKATEWSRNRWYIYFKPLRPDLLEGQLPPIDFHEIMALVAPRALLDVSALNDGDGLTQRQRVLALLKVADAYQFEKASQNFAFFVHGRGHSVPYESRELIYGFLDAHLKPAEATAAKAVE
ncbi:Dienelactone hydrolase family protein [Caulifigura coniformis]|uniref:Dienelactone hydrolase family protein n=1 Tax=Caulifigura coniformis TaxID=2527983 RepID=A0A517S953_9PLAN|nr:dienelactone hydrolase family protein [Caulifigura coniformis]QDT52664.1 Dienelactone hydrolase family protein [Caulifigura coniformis]